MKKTGYLPFVVLCGVLSACSSLRYMSIETYNPADVTFPPDVHKVLIVNNTVPQSPAPFKTAFRKETDTVTVMFDGVATVFCRTLGEVIAESSYFEDVLLYEGSFRADSLDWRDAMLTSAEVEQLCDEQDVDAVVSLDKLLVGMNESIMNVGDYGTMELLLDVTVSGMLRTYLPGRSAPLNAIQLSDTVYSLLGALTSEDIHFALGTAFEGLAEKYHTCFIPHWSEDVRWYYVSSAARCKEAAAFMAAGKWLLAADMWAALYDAAASPETKARMASNLALCSEMTGDFTRALQWAEQACRHLEESDSTADDRMPGMQKVYLSVLNYRIEAEKKLRKQTY
ncbi:MAG: tetratricopeptide repeat protein [Tannerella sp.]|jgi:tetratricopeptide (TPR) repeat protein|nr:tetratricopeptide repeat protein [Tannerella sp.]